MRDMTCPEARPFLLEGGEHAVLLIHGFTGTPGHMRLLGEGLHQNGFTVRGMLLPGHGTKPEDMRRECWQTWLAAAREELYLLHERYARVSVAGLSMGGVLSLLLAQTGNVRACVTISAPMKAQNRLLPLARYAAPFVPYTNWREHPERASLLDQRYDFGYDRFPTKSAGDLHKLMKLARENLFAVTCPLMAVQSRGDTTVSPDSADIILSRAASAVKRQLWLERAPHVCTLSDEYPKIVTAMTEFLKQAE